MLLNSNHGILPAKWTLPQTGANLIEKLHDNGTVTIAKIMAVIDR